MRSKTKERLGYACRLGGSLVLMGVVVQSLDAAVEGSQLNPDFLSHIASRLYQIAATGGEFSAYYMGIEGTRNLITGDIPQ